MKKSILFILAICVFSINSLLAKTFYVAPNGSDQTGDGSISLPFAGIVRAQQAVSPGDTVYLRGGVYKMQESQIHEYSSIFAYQHHINKSGSSVNKRIHYWAYPGERPIIDMSDVKPANYRINVFQVSASYIHFKGLEIIGTQVTIKTHTQSICFQNDRGNYNIYEQCVMRDGQAIGFYLIRGSYNLVLNCDAYNNYDYTSETGRGGNVDGFGFHGKKGDVGNVIRGCRAWLNSDDGYDCINSHEPVNFDNCWAFYNGYSTGFVSRGDGNGFKIGGYGQAPNVANLPNPIPSNLVKHCLAYRNKANGFYANHHVEQGNVWYHNSAYRNSVNFNMLSQYITKSTKTGNDTTIDCPGIRHTLHNNLSLKYSTQRDTLNLGTSDIRNNSFTPGSGITVSTADFVSLNESELMAPRQEDGSLPDIGFMKLKPQSQLIDKGMDIGLPFQGSAPDLGAFEYVPPVAWSNPAVGEDVFFPNPAKQWLYFRNAPVQQVDIYDLQGQLMLSEQNVNALNVEELVQGCFLLSLTQSNNQVFVHKLLKL